MVPVNIIIIVVVIINVGFNSIMTCSIKELHKMQVTQVLSLQFFAVFANCFFNHIIFLKVSF